MQLGEATIIVIHVDKTGEKLYIPQTLLDLIKNVASTIIAQKYNPGLKINDALNNRFKNESIVSEII